MCIVCVITIYCKCVTTNKYFVFRINNERIKEIEKLIYKFIWDSKPDKIKRATLIANYEQGGLKMIDVSSYFKMLKLK